MSWLTIVVVSAVAARWFCFVYACRKSYGVCVNRVIQQQKRQYPILHIDLGLVFVTRPILSMPFYFVLSFPPTMDAFDFVVVDNDDDVVVAVFAAVGFDDADACNIFLSTNIFIVD